MIDDFFDDDFSQDRELNQGIKSFLDQSKYPQNKNSKEFSDVVNQTRKLALIEEIKETQEKESTYSETFQDESKSVESKESQPVSEPLPDNQAQYSESSKESGCSEAASESKRSSTSDGNSDVSPDTTSQKTKSKLMEDTSKSDTLFDISKNLEPDEKCVQFRKDVDVSSCISEEKDQDVTKELPFVKKYAKSKEINERKITEWLQQKKRAERIRRKEEKRIKREEKALEEEEKERKEREEEKKKKRVKEALEEWHQMKNEERRRNIKRGQQEAEEAKRSREKRAAESRRAFTKWLATHQHRSRPHLTSYARTGDRVVTYHDRSRPLPPTYVNPVPWRRL
ncbi:uncharacterized protein [Panulirus ornatus]|uniref:uncharacterized protein n=1 Tax=Panulirus ornatus TaxID=150431 RepID=UPI003A8C873C